MTGGLLVLLLALLLLGVGFNDFSMWYDEVNMATATLAYEFPDSVYQDAVIELGHPPLYFLLVGGWTEVAGDSDFAFRLVSVLAALLAVAFAYRSGIDLSGRLLGGAGAGLLLAGMGFTRYYAHQTHNYTLLLLLVAALFFFYVRWWRHPRWPYAAGLVLATALLLYTHYYGVFPVLALNLHALLAGWGRWRRWLAWLGWQMLAALLYLPWLPVVIGLGTGQYDFVGSEDRVPTGRPSDWSVIQETIHIMSYGRWYVYAGLVLLGFLALYRLKQRARRRAGEDLLLLGLFLLLSFGLALLVNLRYQTFLDRRVIYLLLGAALLAAYALTLLPRRLGWGLLAVGLLITLTAPRPDELLGNWLFREVVEEVAEQREPDDLVFLQVTQTREFNFMNPLPYYALRRFDAEDVLVLGDFNINAQDRQYVFANQIFAEALWPRDRFWVIKPRGDAPAEDVTSLGWVDEIEGRDFRKVKDLQFGWFDVLLYEAVEQDVKLTGAAEIEEGPAAPVQVGEVIQLLDYQVGRVQATPGESVTILLKWRGIRDMMTDYAVGLYVLENGQTIRGQFDGPPTHFSREFPTGRWPVGQVIQDRRHLPINPDAPPGHYNIMLAVYERETNTRLLMETADGNQTDLLRLAPLNVVVTAAGQ
jgi:hypothetical protein